MSSLVSPFWAGAALRYVPRIQNSLRNILLTRNPLQEAENAYKDPKAAEALAAYKSLGEVKSILVKLL